MTLVPIASKYWTATEFKGIKQFWIFISANCVAQKWKRLIVQPVCVHVIMLLTKMLLVRKHVYATIMNKIYITVITSDGFVQILSLSITWKNNFTNPNTTILQTNNNFLKYTTHTTNCCVTRTQSSSSTHDDYRLHKQIC